MFKRRDWLMATTAVALAALLAPAHAQDKLKVAAIYTVPVEQQWVSRIHKALNAAKDRGEIEYVFSEKVANADYERVMREYAEKGNTLTFVPRGLGVLPPVRLFTIAVASVVILLRPISHGPKPLVDPPLALPATFTFTRPSSGRIVAATRGWIQRPRHCIGGRPMSTQTESFCWRPSVCAMF